MPLEAVVYPQDPFGYLSNCKDFMFHDLYSQEEFVAQDTKNNIDKLGHEQSFVEQAPEEEEENEKLQEQGRDREPENDSHRRREKSPETDERVSGCAPFSNAVVGDQASIVGGAINYVKELEHILQSMEPKRTRTHDPKGDKTSTSSLVGPFTDFFSFPQYSTKSSSDVPESSSSPAEIEVTVAESHANIKIMTKKKPRQLLKLITSLQSLRLTLLHLNVTTLHNSILYSISVRVEEGSQLNTVDDIATALNQTIRRIQEET
ncbi:Hypothetical protein [Arabidopsis thaliana]|nr:Hypothetical protein [Arabidopsis thaliana]